MKGGREGSWIKTETYDNSSDRSPKATKRSKLMSAAIWDISGLSAFWDTQYIVCGYHSR